LQRFENVQHIVEGGRLFDFKSFTEPISDLGRRMLSVALRPDVARGLIELMDEAFLTVQYHRLAIHDSGLEIAAASETRHVDRLVGSLYLLHACKSFLAARLILTSVSLAVGFL
jgi:hypothetical protein